MAALSEGKLMLSGAWHSVVMSRNSITEMKSLIFKEKKNSNIFPFFFLSFWKSEKCVLKDSRMKLCK